MYYKRVIKSDNTNVVVRNLNMLVSFDKSSQINIHNIKPGFEDNISFSVENFSNDTIGNYKIIAEVITPLSNIVDDNFVYTIEGVSDSNDTSNRVANVSETPIPVATKEIGNATITPNNKHTYNIIIKLKKDADKNKYSKETLFSLRIKVSVDSN